MSEHETVIIYDYQEHWKNDFLTVSDILKESLGSNIIDVSHIGSTSIPNMPAKNIIDIQIGVEDFSNIEQLKENLTLLGFQFIEEVKQDHVPFKDFEYFESGYEKRFFKGSYNNIKCNLHIRITNAKNWLFAINFRDFLIEHNDVATAYAQFKQRLSSTNISVKDYCLIKDPMCDLIYLLFSDHLKK